MTAVPDIPKDATDDERYQALKDMERQQIAECDDPTCELCAYVRARDEGQS